MRSPWIPWVGPKFNGPCPLRERRGGVKTYREEGYVTLEGEVGMMGPQAQECLEPPADGRGRKDLAGAMPLFSAGKCRLWSGTARVSCATLPNSFNFSEPLFL